MPTSTQEGYDTAISQQMMDEVRLHNESQRLNIEKVAVLRALLGDSCLGGPKDCPSYIPLLTDDEAKRAKKKLFDIIEKL